MAVPWVRTYSPEPERNKNFAAVPRLMNMPPGDAEPIVYFELLFPEKLSKEIIRHTNTYAKRQLRQENLKPMSRVREWKKLTLHELYAFLAVLFNMCIIRKPSIELYWNKCMLSQSSIWFRETIGRNRFQNILRFIHVNDSRNAIQRNNPGYGPAFRFQPLLKFLNQQFVRFKRDLCVDESLLACKGRNAMIQYIPPKAAKYGVKFWILCESSTGYVLQMNVYRGREFDPTPVGQLQGTTKIQFFTCTLRHNRPMPSIIKNANERGSTVYVRKGDFLCMSHFYAEKKKPVKFLFTIMTAQMHSYGKQRKCFKVWKNILLHFFIRIMMNSYILYIENTTQKVKSKLQLIHSVVENLAGHTEPPRQRSAAKKKASLVTLPLGKERDCCVCSSRVRHGQGVRRRSRTVCSLCGRGLHTHCLNRHVGCVEQ